MQTLTCTRTTQGLRLQSICRRSISSLYTHRSFSTTRLLRDDDAGGEDGAFKKGKRAKVDPQTVESWFNGEGLPYRNPTPGKPNWLGGEIPYPDNPTFRPPPPLSDIVRSSIYDRYLNAVQSSVANPEAHVRAVRKLSEQFGISNARVEAIIRLKQYEKLYQKAPANFNVRPCLLVTQGKKIQFAFQKGMESYLGIRPERDRAVVSDSKVNASDVNLARQRTAEVDNEVSGIVKEDQKSGAARRVWWEMVDDAPNSRPIVPGLIAKDMEAHRKKISADQQAHAGIPLRIDGPAPSPGKARSVFTFVDTGVNTSAKKARA